MAVATKTYGVAVIGTGRISGAHARAALNVESIENDTPEVVSVEQARHIVAVMNACEESSCTGREVRLDA
ncbi:MAG: hypothetical protein HY332_20780 [Chloroflexi bacterium]|nr:hypothetical protein [Chloroflexota bacterium]